MRITRVQYTLMLTFLFLIMTGCGGNSTSSGGDANNSVSNVQSNEGENSTVTLRVGHIYPENHVVHTEGYQVLKELVEEKSDGKLILEIFPSEQLGKSHDMVDLVTSQVADIGAVVPAYWADKFPVSQIYGFPGIYLEDWEGAQAMWRSVHEGPISDEVEENGLVPVMLEIAPMPDWVTVDKKIETVEDLKGLKIRSIGGVMDEALDKLGATPVTLSLGDKYTALERGTIDGTIMNFSLGVGYSVHEVVDYWNEGTAIFPIGLSMAAISKEKFNELSPEHQEILYEAGKEATVNLAGAFFADNADKRKIAEEAGVEVVEGSEQFVNELLSRLEGVYDSYVDVLNQRGMDGEQVLQLIRDDVESARQSSNPQDFPDYDILN